MKPNRFSQKAPSHSPEQKLPRTNRVFSTPLAFSIFFAVLGFLWIIGTDLVVQYFFSHPRNIIVAEIAKGVIFVLAMSGVIYWLSWRMFNNVEQQRLQQELERSKKSFEGLVGYMPQGFQVIGFDWTYLYLNDAAVQHARKDHEALIGRKMMEVFPSIVDSSLFPVLQDCMENRIPHQLENTFVYPDHTEGEFYLSVFPVMDGIAIISVDIQEIKQIQEALKASEDRSEAILSGLGEAILFIDSTSREIVYANPAVEQVFGYELEEVIGQTTEIFHISHEHFEQFGAIGEPILEKTGKFVTEYQMKRKDGLVIDTEIIVTSLTSGKGWRSGVVSIVRDITAEKQAEAAIRESEDRFRTLVTATNQTFWIANADGQADQPSESWLAFTGRTWEESTGDQWLEAVHPEDRQRAMKAWWEAVENQDIYDIEYRLLRHDGVYRHFHVRSVPSYNRDGEVKEWIGSGRDITDRKSAEEALKESEEKYRLLAENTLDVIWTMDLNFTFTYVNPAVLSLVGYTAEEFIGTRFSDYVAQDEFEEAVQIVMQMIQEGRQDQSVLLEFLIRHKAGFEIPIEIYGKFIQDDQGNPIGVQGVTRDITERKKSEVQLQRLVKRLNSLRNIDQLITALVPTELGFIQVIQEALNNLDIDAAAIMLISKTDHKVKTVASQGFFYPESILIELRSTEGVAGEVVLERQRIVSPDIQSEARFSRKEMAALEEFRGYAAIPMIVKGESIGFLEVFRREIGVLPLDQIEFLSALAGQAAIVLNTLSTFQDLQISNEKLVLAYDANIEGWSRALDYRDKETEGHSRRVTEITIALAKMMGMSEEQLRYIRWGALLHDIGKMGIPDQILRKPGKLTDEEWAVMKQHPIIARDLLRPIMYLEPSLDIPYCHHEKWDGSGYPRGLKGEDIPLAARIFSVADIWDALRSHRPYREAWPEEKVIEYMQEISGTHLDPEIVDKFLRYWQDIPACAASNYEDAV